MPLLVLLLWFLEVEVVVFIGMSRYELVVFFLGCGFSCAGDMIKSNDYWYDPRTAVCFS